MLSRLSHLGAEDLPSQLLSPGLQRQACVRGAVTDIRGGGCSAQLSLATSSSRTGGGGFSFAEWEAEVTPHGGSGKAQVWLYNPARRSGLHAAVLAGKREYLQFRGPEQHALLQALAFCFSHFTPDLFIPAGAEEVMLLSAARRAAGVY